MAKKRLRNHTNPLNFRDRLTHFAEFVNQQEFNALDLEIGFGRGRFIESYAKRHPERFSVAVEVRKNMVELFKQRVQLPNVLPIWGPAHICLDDVITNQSLSRVFIFHPDPWFKKRHFKRRVLTLDLINALQQKLLPEGIVYISTDVFDLYEDMLNLCRTYGNLELIDNDPFWDTDYMTHWSMFSTKDQRSQYFITFKFKESE
tara:strand:- start:2364 stop:2972 length:609 start_codon:yes stop_codon:yes gene_type:complete